jgi:hypothetical protein
VTHHSIDIAPLTQLRSIQFTVVVGEHNSQWITQILLCISSARLEDVVFDLDLSISISGDIADALEWNNVDEALQRSTFSRLRSVYFRLLPTQATRTTSVIQRLPQCAARGIIYVDQR